MSTLNAIAGIASSAAAGTTALSSAAKLPAGGAAAPFSDLMTDAMGEVNALQDQAAATIRGLMAGTGVDVHQAMVATEKASMAFELALAVRNKAVQAYQQVMSLQF